MSTKQLYQLHYLSDLFYNRFTPEQYPEIEQKKTRPYIVLLICIDNNTFALPMRTNIRHNCCYRFRNSSRPTDSVTGIDFSKAVIVNDPAYINGLAEIDNKEFVELNDRIGFIIGKFQSYLRGYIKYAQGTANEFQASKYRYTTLQYFYNELNIT